ncbi:MAG: hypothetical protein QOH72_1126 [Solirubrobacteraceae bacterium]|nr:hypothetical protein [Solirubrobacteraceae bacterium]
MSFSVAAPPAGEPAVHPVPILLAGAIGLRGDDLVYLISADLFTCGIVSFVFSPTQMTNGKPSVSRYASLSAPKRSYSCGLRRSRPADAWSRRDPCLSATFAAMSGYVPISSGWRSGGASNRTEWKAWRIAYRLSNGPVPATCAAIHGGPWNSGPKRATNSSSGSALTSSTLSISGRTRVGATSSAARPRPPMMLGDRLGRPAGA